MSDNKIWAITATGTKNHAFINGKAMCRKNIAVDYAEDSILWMEKDDVVTVCTSCEVKFDAMVARAEASMAPVNAYDQVCEGVVTAEGAERAAGKETPAPAVRTPADMNRELLRQAQAVAKAHETLFPKKAADPALEFPAGTHVAVEGGGIAVVSDERGVVREGHPNAGLAWVSVRMVTGTGSSWAGMRRRLFVSELTNLDNLHAEASAMDADLSLDDYGAVGRAIESLIPGVRR